MMGVLFGYLFIGLLVAITAGGIWQLAKFIHSPELGRGSEPRPLPHTDFDIIELPHTHSWLRRKKPCYRCIRDAEQEVEALDVVIKRINDPNYVRAMEVKKKEYVDNLNSQTPNEQRQLRFDIQEVGGDS